MFGRYSGNEGKTQEVIDNLEFIQLVLAGLEHDPFDLDMDENDSIFEMARLLGDQADIQIEIVSNDELTSTKYTYLHSVTAEKWIIKYLTP